MGREGFLGIYGGELVHFILDTDKDTLLKKAILEDKNDTWLDYQIRFRNGFKSFQEANKIQEALLLIDTGDMWEKIAVFLEKDKDILKRQLNLIIERRNQIAHEADIEPIYRELREIKVEDVDDSILFVETIVNSISSIVIV